MFVHPWIRLELAEDRRTALASSARGWGAPHRRRQSTNGDRSELKPPLVQRLRKMLAGVAAYRANQHVAMARAHFAHRENDGLTVDLYWEHGPHHDAFRVEVFDSREERHLTLHPPTGRAALEAFYHPFSTASRLR